MVPNALSFIKDASEFLNLKNIYLMVLRQENGIKVMILLEMIISWWQREIFCFGNRSLSIFL